MKNSNDTIGNRSRDTPACSAVPQQLHYRVPHSLLYFLIFSFLCLVTTVQFVVSHFLPAASLDVIPLRTRSEAVDDQMAARLLTLFTSRLFGVVLMSVTKSLPTT
jgi:hypothetical protein